MSPTRIGATTRERFDDQPITASRTARALALLGDHWTLLVLIQIFRGEHRYQQIRDSIHISDSILSTRLKTLTEGGLLTKRAYKDGRTRYEYNLTKSGRATWRIFLAAWTWESEWIDHGEANRSEVVHLACGRPADPITRCGKCDLPVRSHDTSVKLSYPKLSYVGTMPRRHRQARTLAMQDKVSASLRTETMELLGDRWNTALAAAAAIGNRRFTDFERYLGIPPTVLSSRLTRFEELGILEQRGLVGGSSRSEHRLTAKGRAFIAILVQIVRWSDENVETAQPAIEILHDACGRKLLADLACGSCGDRLRQSQLHFPLLAP